MSYCIPEDSFDPLTQRMVDGPWEDTCTGCEFLSKPCVPCLGSSSSSRSSNLPCCPEGPSQGNGDTRLAWNGFKTFVFGNNPIDSVVLMDDNQNFGKLADGQVSAFDHYAVEWVEIHKDGSVHGIMSQRKIMCLWPEGNIASSVGILGTPIAASLHIRTRRIHLEGCDQCNINETMITNMMDLDPDKLEELDSYGGLFWEGMKYISEQNITNKGFTGPLGNGKTFFPSGFRFTTMPTLSQIATAGPMHRGYPYRVYKKLTEHALNIERWMAEGTMDVSGEKEKRKMNWVTPRTRNPGEPDCCGATDLAFLDGTCGGCIDCPTSSSTTECDRVCASPGSCPEGCECNMTSDAWGFCAPIVGGG